MKMGGLIQYEPEASFLNTVKKVSLLKYPQL